MQRLRIAVQASLTVLLELLFYCRSSKAGCAPTSKAKRSQVEGKAAQSRSNPRSATKLSTPNRAHAARLVCIQSFCSFHLLLGYWSINPIRVAKSLDRDQRSVGGPLVVHWLRRFAFQLLLGCNVVAEDQFIGANVKLAVKNHWMGPSGAAGFAGKLELADFLVAFWTGIGQYQRPIGVLNVQLAVSAGECSRAFAVPRSRQLPCRSSTRRRKAYQRRPNRRIRSHPKSKHRRACWRVLYSDHKLARP